MSRRQRLAAVCGALLLSGCALLPAGPATRPTSPTPISPSTSDRPPGATQDQTPAASDAATPAPANGPCSARVEPDDFGHGDWLYGDGFLAEVPLVMTFAHANSSPEVYTPEEIAELKTDLRGRWQLHWFMAKAGIGPSTFELAGGGCTARADFDIEARWFPEADCDPEAAAPSGGATSDDYAELIGADEPSSYWRLEEEEGAETESSTSDTGDLVNDVVLGQPGFLEGSRSALLVESPDVETADVGGWVDIPDVELAGDFTIEAWYRFCGEFVWSQDAIVGQPGQGADVNFAEFRPRLWSGASDIVISDEIAGYAGWQHIAVTRADGDVRIFQNGAQTGIGPETYTDPLTFTTIGRGSDGTFGGWVDEVAFYDHALTAEQIAAHAAYGD